VPKFPIFAFLYLCDNNLHALHENWIRLLAKFVILLIPWQNRSCMVSN